MSARVSSIVLICALLSACSSVDVLGTRQTQEESSGADYLPNLLEERQQIPVSRVNAELNDAFLQLFFGDPRTEAVFRDQGDGSGYIEDIANGDVRADAMSYGMLITVQLDQREVFDKLWSWTKLHMKSPSGASAGLLRWRCDTSGGNCAPNAATDSTSVIATTLFMAQSRWGGGGAHDYEQDGLAVLDTCLGVEERNGGVVDGVHDCFDLDAALPRRGSESGERETKSDYLMPAFYEIWARHDRGRAVFWRQMASNARALLQKITHPRTGLRPKGIDFDGNPVQGMESYRVTTSRTYLNLALDYAWDGQQPWIVTQNERVLDFFLDQGISTYVNEYSVDGTPLSDYNATAHRALVALAAGTSDNPTYNVFIQAMLNDPVPTGIYRYYDGMFYMIARLVLSGQMAPG